jgi:hypothetical protein
MRRACRVLAAKSCKSGGSETRQARFHLLLAGPERPCKQSLTIIVERGLTDRGYSLATLIETDASTNLTQELTKETGS